MKFAPVDTFSRLQMVSLGDAVGIEVDGARRVGRWLQLALLAAVAGGKPRPIGDVAFAEAQVIAGAITPVPEASVR